MSDAEQVTTFGDLIRDARLRRSWKQEDLERESGVSRSTLSRWERGIADRPEPAHVRAVCRVLGVDPREAAVALGYLDRKEIEANGKPTLDPEIERILSALADPALPRDQREQWVNYLLYLQDQARRKAV